MRVAGVSAESIAHAGAELVILWHLQVVTLEQPELEERHHDLVTSIATDQKQLLDIEDQILRLLNEAGSGVEVLDDEVRHTRGSPEHTAVEITQVNRMLSCSLNFPELRPNTPP